MKKNITNHGYTYAWVPNSLIVNVERTKNVYSLRILRSLFTRPLKSIPKSGIVEIDLSLITNQKLEGSICITIKEACEDVLKTQLEITTKNVNKFKIINIFSTVERVGRIIRFKLNPDAIVALIEEQSKGFTKIPCEPMLMFCSKYQHKWVELLCRDGNYKKKVTYEIPELKNALGSNIKKMSHFKKKAIVEPFDEINKKLKASIDYKFIKRGRNIFAVEVFNKTGKSIMPKMIREMKKPEDSPVIPDNKTNIEDDKFDFACNCYDMLPETEKEKYNVGTKSINEFFKRYEAVEKFMIKQKIILDKANTPEEMLCMMGLTYATEISSSSGTSS